MFLWVSPFTFLFIFIYIFIFITLPSLSDFTVFWVIIEFLMLSFIGIAYSVFYSSLSPLIVFFLVQTLSSFFILLSYILNNSWLMLASVIINMGIFPASSWFIYSVSRFPCSILLISCTLHNIPLLILILQFNLNFPLMALWFSVVANLAVIGFFILVTLDMRHLLVLSSVSNNSWFLISQLSGPLNMFLFLCIYSAFLSLILISFSTSLNPRPSSSNIWNSVILFGLVNLSGLPPSPLFLANVLIIFNLPALNPTVYLLLLSSSPVVCSYLTYSIKLIVINYVSKC